MPVLRAIRRNLNAVSTCPRDVSKTTAKFDTSKVSIEMTPNLQIEYRAIDALLPYARNPRTHSPAQIAKIAASIVEFGWTQPILVDGGNGILCGHGRLAAARKLELAEVPVIELGHLTNAQKRAYVIADNRLALDAGWDDELLALELAELSEAGYDLQLTGFEDDELAKMVADFSEPESGDADDESDAEADDDVPEPPKQPITRVGDVWQLGPHRLICGDASDSSVVATLMQGEQASLCFTSPPYGNQHDYTSGGIADWDGLMRSVFAQVPMAADSQVLVRCSFVPGWAGLNWLALYRLINEKQHNVASGRC